MKKDVLDKILNTHKKWLKREDGGIRANLIRADLSYVDLRDADLRDANLSRANLSCANLSRANLSCVDLRDADLRDANLSRANLSCVDLRDANLSCADLSGAYLSCASLKGTNLSGAKGVLSATDYMQYKFGRTNDGYIVYKTFGGSYTASGKWEIKPGSVLTENVNFNRTENCGCGINVAPLEWVRGHYNGDIWRCLIRWEWLPGVCVPYNTDGQIRCERVELLSIVRMEDETNDND